MKTAIEISDLNFRFGKRTLFENTSIAIDKGSFSFIMGKNGSGKSTLLKIIAGLEKTQQGEVKIFDKKLQQYSSVERARNLVFLPQSHKAVFPFLVSEVVLTGRNPYMAMSPTKHDLNKVNEIIEQVDISHLKNRYYNTLSGGEQQMVMIARILAQEPEIILLDEPYSSLDIKHQVQLTILLKKLVSQGKTVVSVIHDPNIAFMNVGENFFVCENRICKSDFDLDFLKKVYDIEFEKIVSGFKNLIIPKQ